MIMEQLSAKWKLANFEKKNPSRFIIFLTYTNKFVPAENDESFSVPTVLSQSRPINRVIDLQHIKGNFILFYGVHKFTELPEVFK